jgi:hypothetical protein
MLMSVNVYPRHNFWMAQPIFTKLGMYNMAIEAISTVHFIHISPQSL